MLKNITLCNLFACFTCCLQFLFYSQKEMVCELANRNLRVKSGKPRTNISKNRSPMPSGKRWRNRRSNWSVTVLWQSLTLLNPRGTLHRGSTEQQKTVGTWLCYYAEHRQPFDEIKHRHTLNEVGDVAEGRYDWKIERGRGQSL